MVWEFIPYQLILLMGEEPFFPYGESQSENKTISPSGSPVSHMGGQDRNKPLSNALCHVFTTLLVSKFSWQNQTVSRLLTKTILYFLHHLYSYLSIHFLIFFFILAMNYYFFFFFLRILAFWEPMTQPAAKRRWLLDEFLQMFCLQAGNIFKLKFLLNCYWKHLGYFLLFFFFSFFLTIYKQLPQKMEIRANTKALKPVKENVMHQHAYLSFSLLKSLSSLFCSSSGSKY